MSDDAPAIRHWARLMASALLIAAGLVLALMAPPWIAALVPAQFSGRISAGILMILRLAHALALVVGPIEAVGMGLVLIVSRRRGRRRPWAARGLLACVSGLIGLALAEILGALWWSGSHRPMPIVPTARRPAVAAGEGFPRRFPEASPPGELNLVVVGGSSARGVPFARWISVGRIVAWQLGRVLPERRIRLEILAGDGQRLDDQHRKLAGLRRRPDVLIVYSGHNEFQSRFAWSREADPYLDLRSRSQRPASWPGDDLPLGRIILEALARYRLAIPPPERITRQLVDVPCCTRDESAAILADFRRRLTAIVEDCDRAGTVPILVIPPGNDADFEPNRSVLPRAKPRAAREAFAAAFHAARLLEATDPAAARRRYEDLLNQQPGFAETHYRLAGLLRRAGDRPGAVRHFILARDLDGQPVRCPSTFARVYHDVAALHPSVLLIDGPAYLRAQGPSGLLDDHLFADGFHPSFLGHVLLARAILEALRDRRALGWPPGTSAPRIRLSECAAHFGLNSLAWKSVCDWSARFYKASAFLRYDPHDRLAKARLFADATRRIAAGEAPAALGIPGVGVRRSDVTDRAASARSALPSG